MLLRDVPPGCIVGWMGNPWLVPPSDGDGFITLAAAHTQAQRRARLHEDTEVMLLTTLDQRLDEKSGVPNRESQNQRDFIEGVLNDMALAMCENNLQFKGADILEGSGDRQSLRLYVKDGFTYEVSVKCVAWPGMKELNHE